MDFTANGQPVLVFLSKVTAEHLPDFDCLDEAISATTEHDLCLWLQKGVTL